MSHEDYEMYDGDGDDFESSRPANHGQAWQPAQDRRLIARLKDKWPLTAIASDLGRSVTAIEMRIEWLATADERKKRIQGYIAKLIREKRK